MTSPTGSLLGRFRRSGGGVTPRELTHFTVRFSILQEAGLPLVGNLSRLSRQTRPGVLREALQIVARDVEAGSSLAEALSRHPQVFAPHYVTMVRAGEAGSGLGTILRCLARRFEKNEQFERRFVGTLAYPVACALLGVVILGGLMHVMQPFYEDIGMALPGGTVLLFELLRNAWLLIPGALLLLIHGWRWAVSSPCRRRTLSRLAWHIPLLGAITRKSATGRCCRTLGSLLGSGVPLCESLERVWESSDHAKVARTISRLIDSMGSGESVVTPLTESNLFGDGSAELIGDGQMTGSLDQQLLRVADRYEQQVDLAVESLLGLLGLLSTFLLGGAFAFSVWALFLPLIPS